MAFQASPAADLQVTDVYSQLHQIVDQVRQENRTTVETLRKTMSEQKQSYMVDLERMGWEQQQVVAGLQKQLAETRAELQREKGEVFGLQVRLSACDMLREREASESKTAMQDLAATNSAFLTGGNENTSSGLV
ncbi:hypothetical protein QFC22_000870 [Naganishia vaughanmartiniae]|uniref:Uncharacterized protein n=1 Tax=Naganishia vaughanmartiniae TaxID=1424756 RepID=A0ACC2XJ80_9TREE|nr:hypothetical protein QFC22_000870 [Naganishia vaughanmartiniae]